MFHNQTPQRDRTSWLVDYLTDSLSRCEELNFRVAELQSEYYSIFCDETKDTGNNSKVEEPGDEMSTPKPPSGNLRKRTSQHT